MAEQTLLEIFQDVCPLLNLSIPTQVINNTADDIRQLLGLANTDGRLLAQEYQWQRLIFETTFLTTATEAQTDVTAALPVDFDRVVDETMWNRDTRQPVIGPLSPLRWQMIKALGGVTTWSQFRQRGNVWQFIPAPPAGNTVAYEYMSKYWCESAGGTAQKKWTADTDLPKVPSLVLVLGLVWRWNKAKGLEYSEDYDTWEKMKANAIGRDGARKRGSIIGRTRSVPADGVVPEGNW